MTTIAYFFVAPIILLFLFLEQSAPDIIIHVYAILKHEYMIKYYNYFIAIAILRFSRPVRTLSTTVNCLVRLMLSRTFSGCRKTSKPHTLALPLFALRIVEVF